MYLASTSTQSKSDVWLIDLGASFHMTPHRERFYEYEKYNGGDVFLGDYSTTKFTRRGRVKLLLKDGRIITLPGVLHFPYLPRNLIYVRKMSDAGVHTVFEKEIYKMVQGAMVLMKGVWCRTLYKLLVRTIIDGCNNSVVPKSKNEERKVPYVSGVDIMSWHQRLGHIGEKSLQSLQGKGMVEGIYNCNSYFDFYEHYLYVKHNRAKFPFGATRENKISELIHSDVFGPVLVPSMEGTMYYVTFIDDLSSNT